MLAKITTSSMTAGRKSPAARCSSSGSAMVDIRRVRREAVRYTLSSRPSQRVRAKRGPMTGSARAGTHNHRSIESAWRMGARFRGDDKPKPLQSNSASSPRRQNLDQLALAGVDLGMLAVPLDGDFLELDVELLVVVDHLAHLRARQRVQVGLPALVGELLPFLGHREEGVELGGVGVLGVLRDC